MFAFYFNPSYRRRQSSITKSNWGKGIYASLIKLPELRNCKNCKKLFSAKPYEQKIFCNSSCAASFNNTDRIQSEDTRRKISLAMQGKNNPFYGAEKVEKISLVCQACKKKFMVLPYLSKRRKFCSNKCAIKTIGRLTTSPKASKGKSGIRADINSDICFYSTWEANIARVLNLIGISWQYAPRIFDLGVHTYRPDFYLPTENMYIEVKNFMNRYSLNRDRLFRERYPDIKLEILSKKEYEEIKINYRPLIDNWES